MCAVLRATFLLALLVLAACDGCGAESVPEDQGSSGAGESGPKQQITYSIIDALPSCDVDHRGLLLDLGAGVLPGRIGLVVPRGIVTSEHDGASWVRVYDRTLTVSFHLSKVAPLFVSLRAIGRDASRVTVSLDGFLLGTLKIGRNEVKVATTRASKLPVDAGLHELKLRFRGNKRSDTDPYGEIDWIRVGTTDELKRTYGAPTMGDVLTSSAQLGGVPHRAISLRAPGAVRCTIRVPHHGRLRTAVGMRGDGNATAAIVVRRDGEDAAILKRVDVKGGADATWNDVDVKLHQYVGQIVTIELSALKTTGTGRLMFGDPVVVVPAVGSEKTARARAVVVVVMDGVERDELPPWRQTETPHLPNLSRLAKTATVFHGHRAPSTLVSAAVASMLTGLSPRVHGLVDAGARLPASARTIAGIASEGSVRAAFFTGVPTTFEPFGFNGSWDKFVQYPPNGGRLASAPLDDAAVWLDDAPASADGRPLLAVLHTRGGHPPWEVKPDEARKLPPADYTGYFGPRRAAQIIAKLEGRYSRLSDQDVERMRALFFAGLSREDQALGKLIDHLEDTGVWDSTLFIVTGDVASGRAHLFQDAVEPNEAALTVPLYVHFPEGAHAGLRVDHPTEVYDITQTILSSLGLEPAADMLGNDLAAIASGRVDHAERIRVALTDESYSVRWGNYALLGKANKRPRLCDLNVDPTCAYDRRHDFPLVYQSLFRRYAAYDLGRPPPARDPLTLDSEVAAMLKVWGSY
jgi:hypothetical protein